VIKVSSSKRSKRERRSKYVEGSKSRIRRGCLLRGRELVGTLGEGTFGDTVRRDEKKRDKSIFSKRIIPQVSMTHPTDGCDQSLGQPPPTYRIIHLQKEQFVSRARRY
jgi:hypothetical protein